MQQGEGRLCGLSESTRMCAELRSRELGYGVGTGSGVVHLLSRGRQTGRVQGSMDGEGELERACCLELGDLQVGQAAQVLEAGQVGSLASLQVEHCELRAVQERLQGQGHGVVPKVEQGQVWQALEGS